MKAAGFEPDLHVQYAVLAACGDDGWRSQGREGLQRTADVVRRTAWPPPAYDARGGRGCRGGGGGRGRSEAAAAAAAAGVEERHTGQWARRRGEGARGVRGGGGGRRRRGHGSTHSRPAGCDGAGAGSRGRARQLMAGHAESDGPGRVRVIWLADLMSDRVQGMMQRFGTSACGETRDKSDSTFVIIYISQIQKNVECAASRRRPAPGADPAPGGPSFPTSASG